MRFFKDTRANTIEPAPVSFDQMLAGRIQNTRLFSIAIGILTGLASLSLFFLAVFQPAWQLSILAALYAITAGICLIAIQRYYPKNALTPGIVSISITFGIAIIATAALLTGMGFPVAVVFLIYTLIVSSLISVSWQTNVIIWAGILTAGAAALLTDFSPFPQLSNHVISLITPAILVILLIVYVVMLALQFVTATLRLRLVTTFMSIVIIPLVILSLIQSQFMFSVLTNEVNSALSLAAQQTAYGVDRFMDDRQRSVFEAAQLEIFKKYLSLPADQRAGSDEEREMQLTLRVMDTNELNSTIYISSYALLDQRGLAAYDTLRDRVASRFAPETMRAMGIDIDALLSGQSIDESGHLYFQVPATTGTTFISQLQIANSTRSFFYISAPVRNKDDQVIGVLRARYDGLLLQDLLKSYNGLLGKQSYAVLFDENNIRLADAYTPNYLYKAVAPLSGEKISQLKADQRLPDLPASMLSTNFENLDKILNGFDPARPVFMTNLSPAASTENQGQIGAISQVRSMPWKVIYLRTDYSEAELRRDQRRLSTLVTTLIACVVGLIGVGISQVLSSPIIKLTATAQQISRGDLDAQAPVRSSDEFGMLGAAFNSMTSQLRTLINQLEDRVKARTSEIEKQNQALAYRARQFQTVSEVARNIVSSQELEPLLASIAQLISERFGFYHVGIFLLDERREKAVLRAANSAGGQRMLARRHSLVVGKVGIVGFATGAGEARIATDVGADAVFFNNPDLPDTRSEMAIPLKAAGQVIGALDIQSTRPNDFDEDDIELFTTLADQVAIAIYNNQLFINTLKALNESQTLHRQYLRTEWAEEASRRKVLGYLYNQAGVTPQQNENPLWRKVFTSGEAVYAVLPGKEAPQENAIMAVPIAVRGETIGVIHVQDQGEDRLWSEDEVAVVNAIASQVAVALENARLFETTVRRADREKKVHQITEKIRATSDPEEMIRIAVSELQQALHASRAQIYVRQENPAQEESPAPPGKNGHFGNTSSERPSSDG